MKITWLGARDDGTRRFEVDCHEIAWSALVRCMRKTPGVKVKDSTFNLWSESTATVFYRDIVITIEVPWADYIFDCKSRGATFDEFVAILQEHHVRWWEKFI